MAIKRECDACKAVTTEHSIEKWKRVSLDPLKPINENSAHLLHILNDAQYDLCERCGNRVKQFLKDLNGTAARE